MSRRNNLPNFAWLEDLPERHRRFLRHFGVAPNWHPRANAFNARLVALADQGLHDMDLAMAASALHEEFFGDALISRAIDAHFNDLIEANRDGDVDQLAFVICDYDDQYDAGLIGGSNAEFLTRWIGAVADVIDGTLLDLNSAGGLARPPISTISAGQLTEYRARIDQALQNLVVANDRGLIAGTAAIVFGQRRTFYRMVGNIQRDRFAQMLRDLRDRIALGQPPLRRARAN